MRFLEMDVGLQRFPSLGITTPKGVTLCFMGGEFAGHLICVAALVK